MGEPVTQGGMASPVRSWERYYPVFSWATAPPESGVAFGPMSCTKRGMGEEH